MNARYPDATAEELERDGTCIICREEMQPWQPHEHQPGQRRSTRTIIDERQRPKKLPCGHVLHFGCLRSWLERQQVCPTCRSSVLGPPQTNTTQNNQQPGQAGQRPADGAQGANQPGGGQAHPAVRPRPGLRARTFRFAGMRFTLAAGNEQQIQEALHGGPQNANAAQLNTLREAVEAARSTQSTQDQIARIERQLMRDINTLNASQEQLAYVRALQGELDRLRTAQANPSSSAALAVPAVIPHVLPQFQFSGAAVPSGLRATPTPSSMGYAGPFALAQPFQYVANAQPHMFAAAPAATVLGPGHPALPSGLTLPEGWNMLPLQRVSRPQQSSSSSRTTAQNVPADAVLLQTPMTSYNAAANAVANPAVPPPNPTHATNSPALNVTSAQPEHIVQPDVPSVATQTSAPTLPTEPQGNLQSDSSSNPVPPPNWGVSTQPSTGTLRLRQTSVTDQPSELSTEDDGPVSGLPNWGSAGPAMNLGSNNPFNGIPNWSAATSAPEENHTTSVSEHADSATSSEDRKGKGRAATVEDVREGEGS